MNNGSLRNLGNRRSTFYTRRFVAALTFASLSMSIGCTGLKAVRQSVVTASAAIPQALSRQQQRTAMSPAPQTGNSEVSDQQVSPPHEITHWNTEHSSVSSAPYLVSPEYDANLGQAANPLADQGAQQVSLASYQQQQAVQQSDQLPTLQSPRPVGQMTGDAARLGIPREMLGRETFGQSVGSVAPMAPRAGQAGGRAVPNQLNSNRQRHPAQTTLPTGTVVNVQGAQFRSPPKTANEIMLELKADNVRMRQDIALRKQAEANLKDQLDRQQQLTEKTELKLNKSREQVGYLREIVAKLQVQVEHLVVQKNEIKQQSEDALRNIETNLDAVLLKSISRTRQKPVSMN